MEGNRGSSDVALLASSNDPVRGSKASTASQLFAGASAGLLADVVMHPVNTVQTNVQSGLRAPRSLSSLYRGFGIVALFSVPSHGLYFCVYDRLRDTSPAAAGLAAEATGTCLLTPSEVLKKRAQIGQEGYGGSLGVILGNARRDLWRAPMSTLRDLYSGLFLSSCVWLPFSAIYFDVYERLRAKNMAVWAASTTGGGVAAFATAPLDIVLTRLQTKYEGKSGFVPALRSVHREMAYFNGVRARIAWLAPCAGISLTTYEFLVGRMGSVPSSNKKP